MKVEKTDDGGIRVKVPFATTDFPTIPRKLTVSFGGATGKVLAMFDGGCVECIVWLDGDPPTLRGVAEAFHAVADALEAREAGA